MENQKKVDLFLDKFVEDYFKYRPVNASFVGKHEYDRELPDFSKKGVASWVDSMAELLKESKSIDEQTLNRQSKIDKKIAEGYLETQLLEFNSCHFQNGNPAMYTGEAVFSILVLFLTDYSSKDIRCDAFVQRANKIPSFLNDAKNNITKAPLAWTNKAISDCIGALEFLNKGFERLKSKDEVSSLEVEKAAQVAKCAFQDYKDYLEKVLSQNAGGDIAIGEEAFAKIIKYGHFADVDIKEFLLFAEKELADSTKFLEEHAQDFGEDDVDKALQKIEKIHPQAKEYLPAFQKIWNDCKDMSEKNDLVTWKTMKIEYIYQYDWAKECAPYLYFLFYRSPAAFNRPDTHFYLVPPLRMEEMSEAEIEKFLCANNEYVIKTNHVIHHGSIGHHVQNTNAYTQSNSIIGKFAGCDCANRPAMIQSGTMIEGWAVYATGLMAEYGLLTKLEQYAEKQAYRRACCRSIVDIKLHSKEFTLEEAADFYVKNAKMSPAAAMAEAVKNSMFPGTAFVYLYGSNLIKVLREAMRVKKGKDFKIGRFHDELLSYGSIPVALVTKEFERKYDIFVQK